MSTDKKKTSGKTFTQIISDSSQKLLASFFDDEIKLKKEREKIQKQINIAVSQKSFVVLQVITEKNTDSFETLAGKIRTNKNNTNLVVLTIEKTKEIRMIPIENIRKVSFLQPKFSNKTAAK